MKKTTKRLWAMALCLLMVFSCLGVQAFAATPENVRQYGAEGGYLAIGDSVCRGCGSPGHDLGQYNDYTQRNVEGAFPYIVAQAVGCCTPTQMTDQTGNYWPLCYPGMTLGVTMDLLGYDDGFTDTKLDYPYYHHMLNYFGYERSIDGVRGEAGNNTYTHPAWAGSVVDLAQRAGLITVELGMCDVFYRALRISENGGFLADGISLDLSDPAGLAEFAKTFLSEMNNGFRYWKTWYPKLIERLQELNPDATIVIVGAFNLAEGLRITDDTLLPVGNAVAAITESMNVLYRQWAKEYGVIYVDISNTETLAAQNEWSFIDEYLPNSERASHPSVEGNAYIGHQILRALPTQDGPNPATTDIVVDLARFTDVSYVLVNGVYTKNYSMDGTVLTIPCKNHLATSLTVAIKGEDGKLALQTYTLTYRDGGYVAHWIFSSNDVGGLFAQITNLIKKVSQSIFSGIAKLFNQG